MIYILSWYIYTYVSCFCVEPYIYIYIYPRCIYIYIIIIHHFGNSWGLDESNFTWPVGHEGPWIFVPFNFLGLQKLASYLQQPLTRPLVAVWWLGGGCLSGAKGRSIPQDQCIQNEFPRKALKRESKLTLLIMIFNDFLIFATVFWKSVGNPRIASSSPRPFTSRFAHVRDTGGCTWRSDGSSVSWNQSHTIHVW